MTQKGSEGFCVRIAGATGDSPLFEEASVETKKPQVKVVYKTVSLKSADEAAPSQPRDPFRRAANEDDDGYDPYSDRPADPTPLFERDPWS